MYILLVLVQKGGNSVFSIGDKIVYPMYGAGVIEGMEEKDIDGEHILYYVMNIPIGNLKIMLSAKKAENLGLRKVSESKDVIDTIKDVTPIDMSENWNQRYKDNLERIKSGELKKVVEVFKTLIFRERKKTLSSAEKKMLGNTKQIILSEMILANNIEKSEAEQILIESIV